jgi:catechol 2,3-dioxygenase-like lactoylglutathione lyase family enzyme
MNSDALLSRVRKLLAMAEADGLPQEARETYNAKAAELIAQYGIDRALLEESGPEPVSAADLVLEIHPPYARDKISLLASIAGPLGCRLVHRTERRAVGTGHAAHLFGMEADLGRTQLLFTSLLVQQAHGLALARPPAWEDARAFRRSWMAGFAVAVRDRLVTAERVARERADGDPTRVKATSVALVLANREARVDAHLASRYPKLRTMRARQLSGSGGQEGYVAGERADLGTGNRVASGARRRALG